jgi:K+-sensing histidine kinase KdpD
MVWHVLGASALVAIMKWRRVADLLRDNAGIRTARGMGFVFATIYALLAVPFALSLVDGQPMPRFNDIFLIGIALTAYIFTWDSAAYLLVISILASAWVLPPHGTLWINGAAEWYRLISFTAVSVFILMLLTRMKSRQAAATDQSNRLPAVASGD